MIDKDFELRALHLAELRERCLPLFSDQGYFARYREILSDHKSAQAWFAVESEFYEAYGCRRFLNYNSFRRALSREGDRRAAGQAAQYVRVYTNVT